MARLNLNQTQRPHVDTLINDDSLPESQHGNSSQEGEGPDVSNNEPVLEIGRRFRRGRRESDLEESTPEARLIIKIRDADIQSRDKVVQSYTPEEIQKAIRWVALQYQHEESESRELQVRLDTMQRELNRKRELLLDIQEMRAQLQKQLRNTLSTGVNRSEKLPDPPVFSKGSTYEWNHFRNLMTTKLEVNGDRYPDQRSRVGYIKSRLAGEALQLIITRQEITPELEAYQVLNLLGDRYADHFAELTAREEYRQLYQKDQPFEEFLGHFRRVAAEARISERDQAQDLYSRLSKDLQDASVAVVSDDLEIMIQLPHAIARREEFNRRRRATQARFTGSGQPTTPAIKQESRTTITTTQGYRPRPTRNVTQITCFNCGQLGHYASSCPKKHPRNDNTTVKS